MSEAVVIVVPGAFAVPLRGWRGLGDGTLREVSAKGCFLRGLTPEKRRISAVVSG